MNHFVCPPQYLLSKWMVRIAKYLPKVTQGICTRTSTWSAKSRLLYHHYTLLPVPTGRGPLPSGRSSKEPLQALLPEPTLGSVCWMSFCVLCPAFCLFLTLEQMKQTSAFLDPYLWCIHHTSTPARSRCFVCVC